MRRQMRAEEERLREAAAAATQVEQKKAQQEANKNVSPMSQANNPASKILEEEFQKGQDFFLLKLADLKIEKQIGSGASAEVYKGTYKEADVAIKKLRLMPSTTVNTLKEFKREVSTLT